MSTIRKATTLAVLALLAQTGDASAAGLQVSPVSLTLKATQNADGLVLSNTGDGTIHAQVRVYHWTQDAKGDQLAPSQGLVISPPLVTVKPGEQQLIRVIRTGAPPNGADAVEDAYRLAVDELPIEAAEGDKPAKALQFVVHYSLPVFVEPVDTESVKPDAPLPSPPPLQWTLRRDGAQPVLEVANGGRRHAQLASLIFADNGGKRTEIEPGLLGYVLPGQTMHWTLKQPAALFAGGGTFEVHVNGVQAKQDIASAERPR
jgi:fimbrial chaperone protein